MAPLVHSALLRESSFNCPRAFPDSEEWPFKLLVEVLPYVALTWADSQSYKQGPE